MKHETRYNPFHMIHQGLRAMLYHNSLQVQQTDFLDDKESEKLILSIKELIWLFESHAHTEDTKVFSLIESKAPDVVADFEKQHEKDHILATHLQGCIEQYEAASKQSDKVFAGRQLQFSLAEFTAFNLSHMNMEEVIIKNLLWQHFTDEQLHQMTNEILADIPPEKNARYSYWMLKGLATHEIIDWFKTIQQMAPPLVFENMMSLASSALPNAQLQQIQEALLVELV